MKKTLFLFNLIHSELLNNIKNVAIFSSFDNGMTLQHYVRIPLLLILFLFESSCFGQCFEIESILVQSCSPDNEGFNEIVSFKVGPAALNCANLTVLWPNPTNPWGGIIKNTATATVVNQLNTQIINAGHCGHIKEPSGGIIPANATVLLVTSQNINLSFNSLANLNSTVYMIFQNNTSNGSSGHFGNYAPFTSGTRTLTMTFVGVCADTVMYEPLLLTNISGGHGGTIAANNGATVNFSPTGVPSYVNNGCQVIINSLPTASISYSGSPFCKSLTAVQATTTGTGAYTGGTYTSGTGLSINSTTGTINPSLSIAGTYTVTYTTPSSGSCQISNTTSLVILPAPTASISADGVVSASATMTNGNAIPLQLNGTFNTVPNIQWTPALAISSTSVSNPLVYPSSTTTYTASFVNSNGCLQTTSFLVNVTPQPNIGTLSIFSPNTSIGLFDTVTVNVQLTNANNLYSLYMKLKSNAAVTQYLDYTGYTAGTLLGTNVISTPPTLTNGVPDFGITKVGAVPGYAGSGLFYSFRFVLKNIAIPAGTTFCFYLDDVSANNSSGIPCGLNNQGQYCYTFTKLVNVWPGDLNKSNTVTTADLLPIGYFYNSTGPARTNTNIQWSAHPATLWGYNHSSQNGDAYKVFADSNGDGVINNADQAAIGFNMNLVHARHIKAKPFGIAPKSQRNTFTLGNLIVTPNNTVIDGANLPQTVTFTVNLNNTGGLDQLYGISVNLIFDDTIFDLSTATIDYAGSIFGIAGSDCLVMNYNSATGVSVGLTRYANAAINGQGLLFKVTIQTKITLSALSQTLVSAYVDSANNQAGDSLAVQEAPETNFTVINNLGINSVKPIDFIFYPNPANEFLYVTANLYVEQNDDLRLVVFNILGQAIDEMKIQNTSMGISTKNWGGSGVYLVKIFDSSNNVVCTKKIILKS